MNPQRRLSYMKALGIPIWLTRTHDTHTEAHTEQTSEIESETELETDIASSAIAVDEQERAYDDQMAMQDYEQYAQYDSSPPTANVQTASSNALALRLIDSLDSKHPPSSRHQSASTSDTTSPPSQSDPVDIASPQIPKIPIEETQIVQADQHPSRTDLSVKLLNWDDLQQVVKQCQYCEMAKFRSNTVFGSGDTNAKWLFIGEAPDVEDDQQGLPFLAKSGQLLDNILAAINLDRNTVYLTNILKCRPPNDRDPHVDEAKHCMNYLHRQIELIQPKVIVVVGRVATKNLLQIKKPLGQMRGYVHYLGKNRIPVVVTYHPRYLLRQPSAKRKLWEDIQLAQSVVHASL